VKGKVLVDAFGQDAFVLREVERWSFRGLVILREVTRESLRHAQARLDRDLGRRMVLAVLLRPPVGGGSDLDGAVAEFCKHVCDQCCQRAIPWALALPHTAELWQTAALRQLLSHNISMVTDHCQFGSNQRRRTLFIYQGVQVGDLRALDHRCQYGSTVCSYTGRPHQRNLSRGWPRLLAREVVKVLLGPARAFFRTV